LGVGKLGVGKLGVGKLGVGKLGVGKLGVGKLEGGPLEDEKDIKPPATTYQLFPDINGPDLSLWIVILDKVFLAHFILSRLDCMLHVTFMG
jgi:hypothetical protein